MVSLSPVTVQPTERSELPFSAQRLRDEARRIRHDAAYFTGTEIRRQMLNVAAQYDVLAEGEERRPR